MALSGARSVLKMARRGGALVDVSAALLGYDGFDLTEAEEIIPVGGGQGQRGAERSGYLDRSGTLNIDENAVTRPLLWGGNGRAFDFEWSREGEGAGDPQWTFSGPCTVSHTFAARNKRRFAVTVEIHGPITRGVHS